MRLIQHLKTIFQTAADWGKPESAEKKAFKVFRSLGGAFQHYQSQQVPMAEFYGRLDETLVKLGWPVEPGKKTYFDKPLLDRGISSALWELSVRMDWNTFSSVPTRQIISDRLHNEKTAGKMSFILERLEDVTAVLKSMTDGLEAELKTPAGLITQWCTIAGREEQSAFYKKPSP